jgi:uridylate kinase
MKKVIVISLGGSQIIPDEINLPFLKKFKKIILNHTKTHKFVIVTGGGSVARKYINALKKSGINPTLQSLSGISATRMNARFMNYFFNSDSEHGIPHTKETLTSYLKKQDVIFCGALEYKPEQTSDSTAAEIAKTFESEFINITNVSGLYDKDPKKHANARLISKISWEDFDKMANKKAFSPGQHFVLDQTASAIIKKNKIKTYIIGTDLSQLNRIFLRKKFKGTLIGV